jgi:hypothetical protein
MELAARAPSKRYPLYCPLALSFDGGTMERELMGLADMFHMLPTSVSNLQNRSRWFDVGDEYLYANVDHCIPDPSDPEERIFVAGKVPGWRGLSLTHVPGHPVTNGGATYLRRKFDGKWQWKEGIDAPYTRRLIESLPFDRIDVARVMTLPEGGFGPAHKDCEDDSPWEVDGIASITLVIRDGGVPTRLLASDGRVHDVRDDAFFFKDCVPHGIPQTRSPRLILRVNGAADHRKVSALMDPDKAIW